MSKSGILSRLAVLLALSATTACEKKSAAVDELAAKSSSSKAQPQTEEGRVKSQKSSASAQAAVPRVDLFPQLQKNVSALVQNFDSIADDRKKQLKKLALFIETKQSSGEPAEIIYICTHNSRRSHLSQLWAATAAAYYGVEGVKTYSGGTEATAFNPRAVAAVERAGFMVETPEGASENPHYQVKFASEAPAQECFSKKYDDAPNPQSGFAAVMTCSQADKNCPQVEGSALRVALPFVDPKESDGTPEEAATYDERSRQIGTEMFYLFSLVKQTS